MVFGLQFYGFFGHGYRLIMQLVKSGWVFGCIIDKRFLYFILVQG